MSDSIFEIKKHFGVIKETRHGWTKELNLVSWYEAEPKFDIRDWDGHHERMSRGITLYEDEARRLYEILKENFES